jgi:hypothetical protein
MFVTSASLGVAMLVGLAILVLIPLSTLVERLAKRIRHQH